MGLQQAVFFFSFFSFFSYKIRASEKINVEFDLIESDDELYSELKTFLVYLKYLPDSIPEVNLEEIPLDNKIVSVLREI